MKNLIGGRDGFILFFCLMIIVTNAFAAEKSRFYDVEAFPQALDSQCREGVARLYDECGSQVEIVKSAVTRAAETGKTTLVVYGAEWCVWCFVLDAYLKGNYREFYYAWERDPESNKWAMTQKSNDAAKPQAKQLNQYVAENFVVAHIESEHAPDGIEAIESIGIDESKVDFYPFIVAVSKAGNYTGQLFAYEAIQHAEQRKDSDGKKIKSFDRAVLLEKLRELRSVDIEEN